MRIWELNDIESKAASRRVVECIIDTIKSEVANGNEVQISGLGKFYPAKQAASEGVAPDGTPWKSPAKTVPKFKASTDFKSVVKG